MKLLYSTLLSSVLVLTACGVKQAADEAKRKKDIPVETCTRSPTTGDNNFGGCTVRLLKPTACEEVDLRGDKTYEFTWTIDSTHCDMPFTVGVGGNPMNLGNGFNTFLKTSNVAKLTVSAADLSSLTSLDGTFEWTVADPHGSHPASRVFRLVR